MAFDFKKEYKEYYMPPKKPVIVDITEMSYKTEHRIEGFYEYVVPPLEGLWKQDGSDSIDYSRKDGFQWVAMIRLPDFITKADFEWAVETAAKKKNLDCSKAEYLTFKEELCVQMMHIGSYDDEPASVEMMNRFIAEQGYVNDICEERQHHEIYLSDPRKTEPSKLKTVIRQHIKKG